MRQKGMIDVSIWLYRLIAGFTVGYVDDVYIGYHEFVDEREVIPCHSNVSA